MMMSRYLIVSMIALTLWSCSRKEKKEIVVGVDDGMDSILGPAQRTINRDSLKFDSLARSTALLHDSSHPGTPFVPGVNNSPFFKGTAALKQFIIRLKQSVVANNPAD